MHNIFARVFETSILTFRIELQSSYFIQWCIGILEFKGKSFKLLCNFGSRDIRSPFRPQQGSFIDSIRYMRLSPNTPVIVSVFVVLGTEGSMTGQYSMGTANNFATGSRAIMCTKTVAITIL